MNHKLDLRIVQIDVVACERRKLRALRRDLTRRVRLVLFDFEIINLGRAEAGGSP